MKFLFGIFAIVMLSGCAANGIPVGVSDDAPAGIEGNTEKKFIGIPSLLALEGSAARLDGEWMVTVAHNHAILPKNAIYHPKCDIAIYRDSNNLTELKKGVVSSGQSVFHVGYPSIPISLPETVQKGTYSGEVIDSDGCIYSASTAIVASGMSGGGVYNQDGELVGITRGIMRGEIKWDNGTSVNSPAVFVPLYRFRGWIKTVTGVDYYSNLN